MILFLGLVVAVMAWIALQRLRDLTAGAALVEEDRLERLVRSRSASGPQAFHGRFERFSRMRLSRAAYKTGQNGARYRVFYSPASRIVWKRWSRLRGERRPSLPQRHRGTEVLRAKFTTDVHSCAAP